MKKKVLKIRTLVENLDNQPMSMLKKLRALRVMKYMKRKKKNQSQSSKLMSTKRAKLLRNTLPQRRKSPLRKK